MVKRGRPSTRKICSICGKPYEGFGNNARPIKEGFCCDDCNRDVVVPRRIELVLKERTG
jgi:hypothetical protein